MSAEAQTSTGAPRQSRVGKRPVPVPKGVTVNISGTTVDVSEGGFRVRLPRRRIAELSPTIVQASVNGAAVAVPGLVLRTTDVNSDECEAVIAFDATGAQTEAVRKLVLHLQVRNRVGRIR